MVARREEEEVVLREEGAVVLREEEAERRVPRQSEGVRWPREGLGGGKAKATPFTAFWTAFWTTLGNPSFWMDCMAAVSWLLSWQKTGDDAGDEDDDADAEKGDDEKLYMV